VCLTTYLTTVAGVYSGYDLIGVRMLCWSATSCGLEMCFSVLRYRELELEYQNSTLPSIFMSGLFYFGKKNELNMHFSSHILIHLIQCLSIMSGLVHTEGIVLWSDDHALSTDQRTVLFASI
jgi:hypothetical protein